MSPLAVPRSRVPGDERDGRISELTNRNPGDYSSFMMDRISMPRMASTTAAQNAGTHP